MNDDVELLSRYAADRSESAFSELIQRHMDLVYSAALRLTAGDAHRAQDVTQLVFVELARQSHRLKQHPALLGWLYSTTRLMALRMIRTEQRRHAREQEACAMNEPTPESNWDEVVPVLEEAMHELRETDRLALLMRFFKNKSLNEVGQALGLSENAARMRVDRALDKLRHQLVRKGVTSTAAVLASSLSVKAVTAAPSGLAATLTTASLATAAAGTGTVFTVFKLLAMTNLKTGFAALVVAGVATTLVVQHQSQNKLAEENRALRQQVTQLQTDNAGLTNRLAHTQREHKPQMPAPQMPASVQSNSSLDETRSTNLYARLGDSLSRLTPEQVQVYLKENGRGASTLLAAFSTSGDKAFLKEAMQNFPNDPRVAFEAIFKGDLSPGDKRQWLNRFEQVSPDNALPNYLSAREYFNAGQTDQAVQELMAATGKQRFDDYTRERMQNDEEAYLAAGYSLAESKVIGTSQVELPQLAELKKLGQQMVDLAGSYRQSGDDASAQAILQMAIGLGRSYGSDNCCAISHLVGMAIERNALGAMDPNASLGDTGQTAQDRLNDLTQQKSTIGTNFKDHDQLFKSMSDRDWMIYIDRNKTFGEEAAMQWVIDKYGKK